MLEQEQGMEQMQVLEQELEQVLEQMQVLEEELEQVLETVLEQPIQPQAHQEEDLQNVLQD